MLKTIVAIFVILHGLTHSIMAMVPSPNAPDAGFATFFSGVGSWLFTGLSESASKTTATTLAVVATLGFVAAGLALWRPRSIRLVARPGDCFGGGLAVVGGHLLASVLDRWPPDRRSGSCHTALYRMVT